MLVRLSKPTLQIRRLSAGSAITAFVPLPAGSRPFSLPQWNPAGTHVSQLYEIGTAGSRDTWVVMLRVADQSTAKAHLEALPAAAPEAGGGVMTTAWAPKSPTLLVVRRKEQAPVTLTSP